MPREPAIENLTGPTASTHEVQSLYEWVPAEMEREAIIMGFPPVFAARRVKEMLLLKENRTEAGVIHQIG